MEILYFLIPVYATWWFVSRVALCLLLESTTVGTWFTTEDYMWLIAPLVIEAAIVVAPIIAIGVSPYFVAQAILAYKESKQKNR